MRFLSALVLLAGCAAPVPSTLRDNTVPVASQVDATLERLQGDWIVVSGAGIAPGTPVVIGTSAARIGSEALSLTQVGPGRLRLGGAEVWVHWLDADARTAALGEPKGARVWIMDRTGQPGERLTAAREILEWYGYDVARMR